MSYPQATTQLTDGNLSLPIENDDNVSLLAMRADVMPVGMTMNTAVKIFSLAAAEQLGITAAYDDDNSYKVYWHVSEFYRVNPGAELHVILHDNDTLVDLYDITNAISNRILAENGRIKLVAFGWSVTNPVFGLTDVAAAQYFATEFAAQEKAIDCVFIESDYVPGSSIGAVVSLHGSGNKNVAVLVGEDNANPIGGSTTCIGLALGMAARTAVGFSYAEASDANNLLDISKNRMVSTNMDNMTHYDLVVLESLGYIFPRRFPRRSGAWFVQSSVCSLAGSDYEYLEQVRVVNKASRLMYQYLVPKVNANYPITPQGRLVDGVRKIYQREITELIQANMSGSYSDIAFVRVDPTRDKDGNLYPSLLTDKTLRSFLGIIPLGKAVTLTAEIGLSK